MPGGMSTSTGPVSTPSKTTAATATTEKSAFCDPIAQTNSDYVFDAYDRKQTGLIKLDQA